MKRHKRQPYFDTRGRCALAGAVALASGTYVGLRQYKEAAEKLDQQLREKGVEERSNRLKGNAYKEALDKGFKSELYARKLQQPNGSGDLQWFALSELFRNNQIPFRDPYIDLSKADLLGDKVSAFVQPDNKDLLNWKRVRGESRFVPADIREGAEKHFMFHVNRELVSQIERYDLEQIRQDTFNESIQTGVVTSGALMAVVVIAHITIIVKRKLEGYLRRRKMAKQAKHREEKREVVGEPKPAAQAPGKCTSPLRPPNPDLVSGIPVTHVKSEIEELEENARNELGKILRRREIDELFDVLGEKLNKKVLREISEGEYGLLSVIIRDSKDGFSFNVSEVLAKLNGQKEDEQEEDSGPVNGVDERVRNHPLMQFRAGGWSRAEVHRLLREWGFELVPGGNDGHFHVTYNGEKVRNGSGRPIIVTHPTKRRAASKGMVSAVLKACAEHLVKLEDQ